MQSLGNPLRNGRMRIAIVTVAAVALLFLAYYLRFNAALDRIQVRNLRLLAVMSSQVEAAIGGYISVVKSLANNPCPELVKDKAQYIDEQTSLYSLPAGEPDDCKPGTGRCVEFQQDLEGVSWMRLKIPEDAKKIAAPSGSTVSLPKSSAPCATSASRTAAVRAGVNLSSEFEYFMPADEFGDRFDLVLIANDDGDIVYQTPYTQLHVANLKSLFDASSQNARAGAGASKSQNATQVFDDLRKTSTLTQVKLGGINYDLYSQPIRLSSWSSELKGPWVLCAFSRPSTSYKEALRISYSVLLGLFDLLILAFLALPWIRVRFLGRYERIRRRDVVFAVGAMFFGLVFALALPVYIDSVLSFQQQAEEQVSELAKRIQNDFTAEMQQIIDYAAAADGQLRAMTNRTRYDETTILKSHLPDGAQNPGFVPTGAYPFVDLVFWVDQAGEEVYKWSAYEEVSPFVNVSANQFYLHFKYERPYLLKGRPFYLGSLLAPTTGTYKAIVGMSSEWLDNGSTPPGLAPRRTVPGAPPSGRKIDGVFLVAQPRSLFRTVVSSGFAFCIVDSRNGDVLFHSDTRRNRNENLFHETDDNEALKGAVLVRHGMVEVNYRGRRDLAYVATLGGIEASPLALVVFADRAYYETTAAEIATVAISLYLVYFVILTCILASIWFFMRPVRLIELIWPQSESAWRYLSASIVAGVFTGVLAAWCAIGEPAEVAWGAVFLGSLGATIVLFLLSPTLEPIEVMIRVAAAGTAFAVITAAAFGWQHRWSIPALTFTLAAVSCVVVWFFAFRVRPKPHRMELLSIYAVMAILINAAVSVAPAVVAYRVAYCYETTLLLKYAQNHIAREIVNRQNDMAWMMTSGRFDDKVLEKWQAVGDKQTGFYQYPFYETTIRLNQPDSPIAEPDLMSSDLDRLIAHLHTSLNTIAIRMGAIARADLPISPGTLDSRGLGNWRLTRDNSGVEVVYSTHDGRKMEIASRLPAMGMAQNMPLWITVALIGALGFLGVRSGIRRIFVMDWRIPEPFDPIPIPSPLDGDYIALTQPAPPAETLSGRTDLLWIDFADLAVSGRRPEILAAAGSLPAQPVGIRNFDYALHDIDLNLWKLDLLERLVISRGMHVVLLTTADPSYYFETQDELPEAVRHRWRLLLRGFLRVRVPKEPAPDTMMLRKDCYARLNPALPQQVRNSLAAYVADECGSDSRLSKIALTLPLETFNSKMDVLAELERYAANYYTYLWDVCSREEKILLYQIARYRFANPLAAEAAYELHRKGLITNLPTQWVMNRSFRRFIRQKPEPEPLVASKGETQWSDLEKSAVIVLLALALPLVIGVVIVIPESPQGAIGVITAALGTLGTLAKLLGGRKTAGAG